MAISKDVEKVRNKIENLFWFFTCQQTKNKRKLFNVIASFAKEK